MGYTFGASWETQLDHYLTTPPEDEYEPKFFCDKCERGLFSGEKYYLLDGENLCPDCAEEWLEETSRFVQDE